MGQDDSYNYDECYAILNSTPIDSQQAMQFVLSILCFSHQPLTDNSARISASTQTHNLGFSVLGMISLKEQHLIDSKAGLSL
jgi:hypothetical protein